MFPIFPKDTKTFLTILSMFMVTENWNSYFHKPKFTKTFFDIDNFTNGEIVNFTIWHKLCSSFKMSSDTLIFLSSGVKS